MNRGRTGQSRARNPVTVLYCTVLYCTVLYCTVRTVQYRSSLIVGSPQQAVALLSVPSQDTTSQGTIRSSVYCTVCLRRFNASTSSSQATSNEVYPSLSFPSLLPGSLISLRYFYLSPSFPIYNTDTVYHSIISILIVFTEYRASNTIKCRFDL